MRVRRALILAVAGTLGACGGNAAGALAERVVVLERRVAEQEARHERLLSVLREHGIRLQVAAPASGAEATARALDDLEAALGRLELAKENQDTATGQGAMAVLDAALQTLRQDVTAALPALLARAEAAGPVRQGALLDCLGKVGGTAALPGLMAVASDATRLPGLRVRATRILVELDPLAAIPVVESLLRLPAQPDSYLLVHLLAGSGRPEVVPVLITALRDCGDRSVRCHAATGLGHFAGVPAAVAELATAAESDEYPAVRTNALRALARVADAGQLRAIAARVAAGDADAAVRAVASELLPPDSGR